jgi:hypothetical protein
MSTLTGMAIAAVRRAERVPIDRAAPPETPGWYTLELDDDPTPLFVGETADLAARLDEHRAHLRARPTIDPARVFVRWVEARPILGSAATSQHSRRAIDAILVSILQPLWDADYVAALRPLSP